MTMLESTSCVCRHFCRLTVYGRRIKALSKLDCMEELYEVTGEFDIVTLVSASDIEEFREILKNKI